MNFLFWSTDGIGFFFCLQACKEMIKVICFEVAEHAEKKLHLFYSPWCALLF